MKNQPKTFVALFAILLASSLFSLPVQGAISVVEARNFFYAPSSISVQAGDTVRFVWVEGNHPTASLTAAWSTFPLNSSNPQFDLVLATTGTYNYECIIHAGIGMVGTITVTSSGATCNSSTAPFGLNASPGTNNAALSWAVLPNTNLYQVRGRKVGTSSFRKRILTSTGFTAPGLMPGTTYEWEVRALCIGTDAVTPWSGLSTFTTSVLRQFNMEKGRAWASPEGYFAQLPEPFQAMPVQGRLVDVMGRLQWSGTLQAVDDAPTRIPYSGKCQGRCMLILENNTGLISIPLDVLQP